METNNGNQPVTQFAYARPILGFGEAIKICFQKFFDFTGRARRSEYWWFTLFQILVSIPCAFMDGLLDVAVGFSFLNTVASIVFFFPSLTVSFRRLHDIGRSGWWLGAAIILFIIGLIALAASSVSFGPDWTDDEALFRALFSAKSLFVWLPIIAAILLGIIIFVFSLLDSEKGENKYGPSPKYEMKSVN